MASPVAVRAQDTIGQGKPSHRDGSSTQDPEAIGRGVDPRRLYRVIQSLLHYHTSTIID